MLIQPELILSNSSSLFYSPKILPAQELTISKHTNFPPVLNRKMLWSRAFNLIEPHGLKSMHPPFSTSTTWSECSLCHKKCRSKHLLSRCRLECLSQPALRRSKANPKLQTFWIPQEVSKEWMKDSPEATNQESKSRAICLSDLEKTHRSLTKSQVSRIRQSTSPQTLRPSNRLSKVISRGQPRLLKHHRRKGSLTSFLSATTTELPCWCRDTISTKKLTKQIALCCNSPSRSTNRFAKPWDPQNHYSRCEIRHPIFLD